MDAPTPPIEKQPPIRLLEPLRPVVDNAPLVVRAERLSAALAPYENSPRLDARFRMAIGQLSLALRGIEGMRANDFALDVINGVVPLLEAVLDEADAAVTRALHELELGQPARRGGGTSRRSGRSVRSAAASTSPAGLS